MVNSYGMFIGLDQMSLYVDKIRSNVMGYL